MTEKEDAAIRYILSQIYAPDMLEQLNFEGGYEYEDPYTMEEVQRVIAMIHNMCG